jgi:hypothetical protein
MPNQDVLHFREGDYSQAELEALRNRVRVWAEHDVLLAQLQELEEIRHLSMGDLTPANASERGDWIYFPWSGVLYHGVTKDEFDELRTNRNRNIIDAEAQRRLLDVSVSIAGLSIGINIALAVARSGIGSRFVLADRDTLAATNLNRTPYGATDIGIPKTELARRALLEISPYIDVVTMREGVLDSNISEFVGHSALVYEEIDSWDMKLGIRVAARDARVPVVMLTNLGDNLLVDVERFDNDPDLPVFNGRLGWKDSVADLRRLTPVEQSRIAVEIVGADNVPTNALMSLPEIGRTLVGRPQVASSVTVGAGLAALVGRQILLGADVPSGRQHISLRESLGLLVDDYGDGAARAAVLGALA